MAVSILIAVGWALLYTLLGLLALLLILLLLLLFLPFDIFLRVDSDLEGDTYDEPLDGVVRWLVRLRWGRWVLTGHWEGEYLTLTRSEMRFCGIRLRSKGRKRERPKPQPKKRRRERMGPELIMAFVEEGARFLARCVEDLGIKVTGQATYGFSDPAITGWCEGIRWAVELPNPISLEPDFTRPCLKGWSEAQGRTYGYRVAAAALRVLRNPVIRKYLAKRIRFKPLQYVLLRGG